MNKFLCGLVLSAVLGLTSAVYKLEERFSWNELDWVFPSPAARSRAIASGDYIPRNGLPVGIERWGNKLFVTVPRWRDGIPATLNYIDMDRTPAGSPPLIPYPNLDSNRIGDCPNGLNTAYRIKADKCGRLWVLDTGTIGIGNTTRNVCPYALNVFDLATDTRIRRYEFNPEDTNPNTFIANIAIDIGRNCEDTYAYFSDELGYGLISYSWEQNRSWRFSHSFFFPDPLRGDFNIAGLNFQWFEEGIFGMALSPMQNDGFRTLYFSPLASHREFSVSTRILRDSTRLEESFQDFSFFPNERAGGGHTTSRVMSDDGLMLFNLIDQNAVGCWHSSTEYAPQNHDIVDRDDVGLVFPADVKIDETNTVWVISDRMPVFLITELDFNDINFRIFSAPLASLVAGTVCDKPANPLLGNKFTAIKPIKAIKAIKTIPQSPAYEDYSIDNLSPGYTTGSVNSDYTQPPNTAIINAEIPPTPKAFVYNHHPAINYKAQAPTFVSYFSSGYQPKQPVRHYDYREHKAFTNDWHSPRY
jgi:hypothetical protein